MMNVTAIRRERGTALRQSSYYSKKSVRSRNAAEQQEKKRQSNYRHELEIRRYGVDAKARLEIPEQGRTSVSQKCLRLQKIP